MKTLSIIFTLGLAMILAGGCQRAPSANEKSDRGAEINRAKIAVWIDTDPSIAPGGKEVDDGFALIQAFHSPELEICGVSVVFGNAPFDVAWPIGQEIVRKYGPPGLPVFAGAARAEQLGEETDASRALVEALRKEKLTILALGPVTNVATVLKNHPELSERIEAIVAVAGRRPNQRFVAGTKKHRPFRDFNFELDPAGFQVLLDTKAPMVLAPWEISSKVWLKEADLELLASGNAATQWLVKPATDWLRMWQEKFGADGFNPFDTLAVAYLTSPHLITWEELPVEIRMLPDDAAHEKQPDGGAKEKPYLLAAKEIASKRVVRYCFNAALGFKNDLMARLLKK